MKTITAGDYAVEFDLDPDFFDNYMKYAHDEWLEKSLKQNRVYKSRVQAFTAWIQNEMEEKVS